ISPIEYVNKAIEGEIKDPVLLFQLKNGFRFIKILPNYLYDKRSLNYATFIELLNPYYKGNNKKMARKIKNIENPSSAIMCSCK
ncbi:MAG TPA: hypothetical protein VKA98_10350, partial [Nitrososphaeraceae archaeon]|nr:hypothetical protein [Nitrososphaeraceae archaeon]